MMKGAPGKEKWCSGQSGRLVWESCGGSQGFKTGWWQTFLLFLWGKDRIVLCYTIKQSRNMTGFILEIRWKLLKPCKLLLLNVSLDIFFTLQTWATCLNCS